MALHLIYSQTPLALRATSPNLGEELVALHLIYSQTPPALRATSPYLGEELVALHLRQGESRVAGRGSANTHYTHRSLRPFRPPPLT